MFDRSMSRAEYDALRRAAYRAEQAAKDSTIAYADRPSWVQSRADESARAARAKVPHPEYDHARSLARSRTINRRREIERLLKERRWHAKHGMPIGFDNYEIRRTFEAYGVIA